MIKSHRHYEFGTFGERLEHICALFEIEAPDFPRDENGTEQLTDENMAWVKAHNINMDWLFAGSPSAFIKQYAKTRKDGGGFIPVISQLDPEIVNGLHAMLHAVTVHNIPMVEATTAFDAVVKEYRGAAA